MHQTGVIILLSFLASCGAGSANCAAQAAPDHRPVGTPFRVIEGLVWASPGGVDLKADLYLPKGRGPFPVVLYLHGGAWSSGDRTQLHRQAADLAAVGIAGFAIEYRLAGQYRFPIQLFDAKAAVRWLRAHANHYPLDATRIAAVGSSAGGHLAAMLGLTQHDSRFEGDGCCRGFPSTVVAVAAFNPVLDLTDMGHRESMITELLGRKCEDSLELCRDASPIAHIHPMVTPFLILHGTADVIVPYGQAATMVAKLKAAEVPVEMFTADGAPHTFWAEPRWYQPSLEALENFLTKVFSKTPGPQIGRR